ncbi:hypothetical protein QYS49_00330 [Marivirga salinae]|uniref:Uncharacterized protein n=1 Tax=Marivirga salinarum TaxID=3059078 RepID=A0AA49J9D5_9BACT|nr:hypothetical protein [Marivirga sp. BDSF4-3]WKK75946.1 hypothetical protein QYS49_00330 [Marivirga sp. BDSF4-3]
MEKQYNIEANQKNYLKQKDLFQMILITFFIYLALMIVFILDSGFSTSILWFSLTYFFAVGIGLIGRYNYNSPLDNTIIYLQKNQITRKGKELRTVIMNFDEVTNVEYVKHGMVLYDTNASKFYIMFAQNAYATEAGILFIPNTIEDFEEIKNYVLNKIR